MDGCGPHEGDWIEMNNGVRPEITEIFADVFQFSDDVRPETSPDDVAKWDSLQHLALVGAIEQTFGISLSMDEMMEIRTVNDITNILERHGA